MLPSLLTLTLATSAALAAGADVISPEYDGNCHHPRWSPDGSKLAYEVNYHDRKVVEQYVYASGGGATKVSPVSRGASSITSGFNTSTDTMVVHELSWSPPGLNTFVYAASGADREYDLYLGTGTRLASSPGADGGPAWSPNGELIAFTSARTGEGDLYLLDVNKLDSPPKRLTTDATASELYVAWSSNNRSVAYVGHTRTGDTIHVVDDINDPIPRAVASLGNIQTRPAFSPDGRSLAFYSNHEDKERFDLYVMPLDGAPKRLAKGVVLNDAGPQWTPDGAQIVYVLDDPERFDPVYVGPVSGGVAKPVPTRTVGNGDHHVVGTPDGRVMLAISAQGRLKGEDRDFKRVYVMQLP